MATVDDKIQIQEENQDNVEFLENYAAQRQTTFQEMLQSDKYDIVAANHDPVHGSYIIMADKSQNLSPGIATVELGYSSPSPWTAWTREERVPELRDRQGLRTYYDMKRSDGTVRGALRLLKTPIQAARWFVEPASDSTIDKNIAEFVEDNLFRRLNVPWSRFIEDALLMCDFGYMPFEKVFDFDPKDSRKIILTKLAPRHPMDIQEWVWDDNGGPDGFKMEPISIMGTEARFSNGNISPEPVFIPINKAIVFTLEQEAGDLRGISILRSVYKHYYYKDTLYKIDAIQKERHGIGVPIIKLPPGFSTNDRALAENLGRNLRTNERAHITVPMNWEVTFAVLGGNPVDCMKSIDHHDMKIKSNILAPFMDESNVNPDSLDVYYKATRYIASTLCDTVNHYLIPQLVGMNFTRGNNPYLRVRRIGEEEALRTLSFAFRNFVGAGAIIPDDPLEKFLRSELDLPPADPDSARIVASPQNPNQVQQTQPGDDKRGSFDAPRKPTPPDVRPPRQAPSPPVSTGKRNTGQDKSGGN